MLVGCLCYLTSRPICHFKLSSSSIFLNLSLHEHIRYASSSPLLSCEKLCPFHYPRLNIGWTNILCVGFWGNMDGYSFVVFMYSKNAQFPEGRNEENLIAYSLKKLFNLVRHGMAEQSKAKVCL